MLFNSFSFILLFLPAIFAGFHLFARHRGQRAATLWLIVASLVFYAAWRPSQIWLPVLSVGVNYMVGARMFRLEGRGKLALLWFGVALNVALLAGFKAQVAGFFGGVTGEASAAFSTTDAIIIPLGISFITFQQIAFLVDIYKGRIGAPEPAGYAFFILFFPQLVMGPIVHHREIVPQLQRPAFLRFDWDTVSVGLAIFVIGLFKKVVLADGMAPFVNQIYAVAGTGGRIDWLQAWVAAIGFQLQIYFDFSGYADMAVGLGRLFNINLPINFDSPYRATDRYDLWRRWHITFAQFMRAYVFVPLQKNRIFRLPGVAAMVVTVFLSGIWHGLGWTFLFWGLLQGAVLIWLHYYRHAIKALRWQRWTSPPRAVRIATCFFVTVLIGVLFRAKDMAAAGAIYHGMLSVDLGGILGLLSTAAQKILPGMPRLNIYGVHLRDMLQILLMAAVVWGLPNLRSFFGRNWTALDPRGRPPAIAYGLVPALERRLHFSFSPRVALVLAAMLVLALLSLDETSRFIYYQF